MNIYPVTLLVDLSFGLLSFPLASPLMHSSGADFLIPKDIASHFLYPKFLKVQLAFRLFDETLKRFMDLIFG